MLLICAKPNRATKWAVMHMSEAVRALRSAAARLHKVGHHEEAKRLAEVAQRLLSDERPWPKELAPPNTLPLGAA